MLDLASKEEFHGSHAVEPTDYGGEYCTLCGASTGPSARGVCPFLAVVS